MSIFKSHTDHETQAEDRPDLAPDDRLAAGGTADMDDSGRDTGRDYDSGRAGDEHDTFDDRSDTGADTGRARTDIAPDDQVTGRGESDLMAGRSESGDPTGPRVGDDPGGNGTRGETRSATRAAAESGDGEPERLVPRDRAEAYSARWDHVKGGFVDEPREAVGQADALVGELLDELQELFRAQRSQLERGLDSDSASTEDMRMALRRYRSFFDRLVSF